jgi:hypothetical protein|tara:strand:+ start:568 stop:915 length:348 start_codon:yes stop_codon:yes gene_type:complete
MSKLQFDGLSILKDHSKIHKQNIILASNKVEFGESLKWKFPNNWGASVVATSHTQWRPQLVILKFSSSFDITGTLICDGSITKTLNGHIEQITIAELAIILAKIQGLPQDASDDI